jgi:hypothetical protein
MMFEDVKPRGLVEMYRLSEERAASVFRVDDSMFLRSQATRRHIPEGGIGNRLRHEHLSSRTFIQLCNEVSFFEVRWLGRA